MVKAMEGLDPSVKLLTLCNVQSAKPTKRQRATQRDWHQIAKKHKAASSSQSTAATVAVPEQSEAELTASLAAAADSDEEEEETASAAVAAKRDSYDLHWAQDSPLVEGKSADELKEVKWIKSRKNIPGLGQATQWDAQGAAKEEGQSANIYNARLMEKLKQRMADSPFESITPLQTSLLTHLSTYSDLFHPSITLGASHSSLRSAASLHAMNHVLKTRSRVLKNNDALARAAADPTAPPMTRNTQDQGFTRPKVLVLLPFRNSAKEWVDALTSLSGAESVENKARFDAEYSLPEGATDKLEETPENYAEDHVNTFKGNIDDSFRVGLKVTRKTVKLYSEFYSADVIVASPLGLRTSIEKEKGDSDFLSSIEILIVDQMDVMTMQNWDHLQFIMDRLNKLPEEAHGCDFSRVKPWYLDGKASSLRQTLLLSSYETPEMRSLFTKSLLNLGGKTRLEPSAAQSEGVLASVPKGIKQVWQRFEVGNVAEEDDKRFEWFTTKTLPMLLKSAVSSSQTIIFVPSYFDFVRLKRYMKKLDDFSFASISEYSPTPDVSRARGAFFAGKKNFLLITERFHFFRRYRIRGAKTVVFYAPPQHSAYYPEVLSFPFPRLNSFDEPEVDPSELSAQCLFSKFDLMSLQRIVGQEDARRMVGSSEAEGSRFTFLE